MLTKVLTIVDGKKTYLCAAIIGIAAVARYLGYVSDGTYELIVGLFGAGGAMALRQAVAQEKKPLGAAPGPGVG